jgi:predicted phosphodiesterase
MRFQIHSDIHLEKYPNRRITPKTNHLILAGDIGVPVFKSYQEFFKDTSRKFDKIIYVLGNHEFERIWIGIDKNNSELLEQKFLERKKIIKDILSEFTNVKLLDDNVIHINNRKIYGTTLWTNYYQRNSSKQITNVEKFISHKHLDAMIALQDYTSFFKPDIFVSHFVSNKNILDKPWKIGLGPKYNLNLNITPNISIFGHIHYAIRKYDQNKNLFICNPWGESKYPTTQEINLD